MNRDLIDIIRKETPIADRYAQLAEEYIEAGHAALKMARIIRGVSPTNVLMEDAIAALSEEMADVRACLAVIGLSEDEYTERMTDSKLARWAERLKT